MLLFFYKDILEDIICLLNLRSIWSLTLTNKSLHKLIRDSSKIQAWLKRLHQLVYDDYVINTNHYLKGTEKALFDCPYIRLHSPFRIDKVFLKNGETIPKNGIYVDFENPGKENVQDKEGYFVPNKVPLETFSIFHTQVGRINKDKIFNIIKDSCNSTGGAFWAVKTDMYDKLNLILKSNKQGEYRSPCNFHCSCFMSSSSAFGIFIQLCTKHLTKLIQQREYFY